MNPNLFSRDLNVKEAPFYAKGDGIADDTAAIQLALDALMESPTGGGLFFPEGNYKITYSLILVGDYGHSYRLSGKLAGQTHNTRLTWAGPPGCTMLSCWGLNFFYMEHLTFDGGAHNLMRGGEIDPRVAQLGAGCCFWSHTNQFSTLSHAGITPGAGAQFAYFTDCCFGGVIGGFWPTVGIGDGPKSPGDLVVDHTGAYTLYKVPGALPTVGENNVDTMQGSGVPCVSTTLTAPILAATYNGVANVAPITAATNASPINVTVTGAPGWLVNGATIYVDGVLGNLAANGVWVIGGVAHGGGNTTFNLVGSVGSGAYTSGGSAVAPVPLTVADVTGFVVNRAVLACNLGTAENVWHGRVLSIDSGAKIIYALDNVFNGPGYNLPSGDTVFNTYPNASAQPRPGGATIVTLSSDASTADVIGYVWEKSVFEGGGWDTACPFWIASHSYIVGEIVRANPDTGVFFECTVSGTTGAMQPAWDSVIGHTTVDNTAHWVAQSSGPSQYNYACVAVYSGFNTEVFGWRDCEIATQGAVFGIASFGNANNGWFLEDTGFSNFSAAGIYLSLNNFAKLNVYQCGCESTTGYGFLVANFPTSGITHIQECEIFNTCVGNFNTVQLIVGAGKIERCGMDSQLYDIGPNAQPGAIFCSSGAAHLDVEYCTISHEQYQIPIFQGGNEVFGTYRGTSQQPGTNRTHLWDPNATFQDWPQVTNSQVNVRVANNLGTDPTINLVYLPNSNIRPVQTFGLGPMTVPYAPAAAELYRAVPRVVTSGYEYDASLNAAVYLCILPKKTVLLRVVVEVVTAFTGGGSPTVTLGTQAGSYDDVFNGASIGATVGSTLTTFVPLPPTSSPPTDTWTALSVMQVAIGNGPYATGKLRVYLDTITYTA
jgi:Pectate lyase superfamily protein